jgi:hypothetical protein
MSRRLSARAAPEDVMDHLCGFATRTVAMPFSFSWAATSASDGRRGLTGLSRSSSAAEGWSSKLRVSIEDINEAVLQSIEQHALTPDAIEQVVQLTERDDLRERHVMLERDWSRSASVSGGWWTHRRR